MWLVIF